jgi:hypothetical protein
MNKSDPRRLSSGLTLQRTSPEVGHVQVSDCCFAGSEMGTVMTPTCVCLTTIVIDGQVGLEFLSSRAVTRDKHVQGHDGQGAEYIVYFKNSSKGAHRAMQKRIKDEMKNVFGVEITRCHESRGS